MQSRFADITKTLQQEFPSWFKIRKSKSSIGAQFLNIFGLQYEDVEFYLEYAFENQFISTADLDQVDIVYKARIPSSLKGDEKLRFYGDGMQLQQVKTLKEFYEGVNTNFQKHKEIYYRNPYFIDWEHKTMYIKKKYNESKEYKEGSVTLRIFDEHTKKFEMVIPTHLHHVWNFFDEFGLLLDTPRHYGERNREYKARLLDVFKHPANSSYKGMQHSVSRELDLWKEAKWYDGSRDFTLRQARVLEDSIEVNGERWPKNKIYHDDSGRTVLIGEPAYEKQLRTVRFIYGLEMHTFHDKRDYAFQKDLYSIDRVATPMLEYYVDIITNRVPIMWDQFIWNEAFWNIADEQMSGYGYIPNFNDARFLKWKNYKG